MTLATGIETGAGGASVTGEAAGIGNGAGGQRGTFANAGFVAVLHAGLPSGLRNSEPAGGGNFRSSWQAELATLRGSEDDPAPSVATDTSLTESLPPRLTAARAPLGTTTPASASSILQLPPAGQSPSVLAGLRARPAKASPEIAAAARELAARSPKGKDSASHAPSHSYSHAQRGSSSAAPVAGAGNASLTGAFIQPPSQVADPPSRSASKVPALGASVPLHPDVTGFDISLAGPSSLNRIGKASRAAAVAAGFAGQDESAPVSAGEQFAEAGYPDSTAGAAPDAMSAAVKQDAFAGAPHGEAASRIALPAAASEREFASGPAESGTHAGSPTTAASPVQDRGQVESPAAPSASQEAFPPGLLPQPQAAQLKLAQPPSLTPFNSGHSASQDAALMTYSQGSAPVTKDAATAGDAGSTATAPAALQASSGTVSGAGPTRPIQRSSHSATGAAQPGAVHTAGDAIPATLPHDGAVRDGVGRDATGSNALPAPDAAPPLPTRFRPIPFCRLTRRLRPALPYGRIQPRTRPRPDSRTRRWDGWACART
jgi:hypothetical protein